MEIQVHDEVGMAVGARATVNHCCFILLSHLLLRRIISYLRRIFYWSSIGLEVTFLTKKYKLEGEERNNILSLKILFWGGSVYLVLSPW